MEHIKKVTLEIKYLQLSHREYAYPALILYQR